MTTILYWFTTLFLTILAIALIGKIYLKLTGGYADIPFSTQLEELITIPFHLFAFIALFAYLDNKPVFSAFVWQVYLAISILIQIVSYWLPKQQYIRTRLTRNAYFWANVGAVLPLLPLYYMLINYAFVSFPGDR
tara:strand:+ start:22977 stop:23381 length:405 start_codon:yes stop_codon:yes gene_type:complete